MSALQATTRGVSGAPPLAQPKALALRRPGGFDPAPDALGWLAQALVAELGVVDARHLDVDIDAVEQRSGDALLVLGDTCRSYRYIP